VATRKKRTAAELRQAVFKQKAYVYSLAQRYEEMQIYERLTDRQKDDLNAMLQGYQRMYGPVQYHNWLRAVMRSMRGHFTDVGQVLISPVLERKHSDATKRQFLEVMALQMSVDVTVTLNKPKKHPL
jgi:hypothetical protein